MTGLSSTSRKGALHAPRPVERLRNAPILAVAIAAFALGCGSLVGCTTPTAGTGPELPIDAATADAAAKLDARPPADAKPDTSTEDVTQPPADATLDAADASPEAGPDAGPDAPPDTAPPPCDGLLCNGACLHASDCSTCTGATLLCGPAKTCVEQCAFCRDTADAGMPIECYACDSSHANPIGTCESTESSYCIGGDYFSGPAGTGYHCGCASGNGSDCPGTEQVCFTLNGQHLCATCGEPIPLSASGGSTCKAPGTTCDAPSHTCH